MPSYEENREALIRLIELRQQEIKSAGPLHKRDLNKNLHRLMRELRDYERFHKEANENGKR